MPDDPAVPGDILAAALARAGLDRDFIPRPANWKPLAATDIPKAETPTVPDPSTARDARAVAAAYRRAAQLVLDRTYPGLRRRWLTRRTVAAWLEWQADLAAQVAAERDARTREDATRA